LIRRECTTLSSSLIDIKPFPSWVLNSDGEWKAPIAYPDGAGPADYMWDEDTTSWVINNSEG